MGVNPVWSAADPVDLGWRGIPYTRVYLGLDVPPASRVRAALELIAARDRAVGRVFADDGRWRPVGSAEVAAWADEVLSSTAESGVTAERAFELVAPPSAQHRFRLLVGPDWIGVAPDHSFGDGRTVDLFIGHLLRQAGTEEPLDIPWKLASPVARDLAIARGVARHLDALPYVLRHRSELAGGDYEVLPAGAVSTTRVDASDATFMARMRQERRDRFPQASTASLVVAGLRRALAANLAPPRPGFECLFNTRREAEGRPVLWGNWSAGAYLRPVDDADPAAIGTALREARERGIADFGLAAMRAGGRSHDADNIKVAAAHGVPRMTLSYIPEHFFSHLPGVRPGETSVATRTVPNGLDTITFQVVEVGGRLVVSTAFFPSAWESERVARAVRLFLDSGISLIEHVEQPVEGA